MTSESNQNDQEILNLLKEAGIDENSPIDPSSRLALQELLFCGDDNQKITEIDLIKPAAPLPQVDTSNQVLQRHVSELSDFGGAGAVGGMASSNASTAGDGSNNLTKEDLILRKIEQQTALIVGLHKRMDDLTFMLQNSQTSNKSPPGTFNNNSTAATTTTLTAAPAEPPVVDEAPPPRPAAGLLLAHEYATRVRKLVRLFCTLFRHQVPNLDAGLIFKVIVMLAILLSRLSHRRKRSSEEDWMWNYRFYFLVLAVVGGFLVQSGFCKFLYLFFVQHKYPMRILWKGEDIDVAQEGLRIAQEQRPAPPPPPPRPRFQHPHGDAADDNDDNNNNNQAPEQQPPPALGWRDTFLGGGIARNQGEQPGAGLGVARLLGFIVDVGYVIGSFFLSIFPMWRPEPIGLPPVQLQEEEPLVQNDFNDNGNENNDDDNGLPQVQPPWDAMEAAEDDDDEQQEG